jgi:hypothetical protein
MTDRTEPVPAGAAPMPRLSASSINDDQLDALYAERDLLARLLVNKVNELVDERRHYRIAATAIARVRNLADVWLDAPDPLVQASARDLISCLDGPPTPRTAPPAAQESHTGLPGALKATGGPR